MKKEGSEKERCFKTDLSQSNVGSEKRPVVNYFFLYLVFFLCGADEQGPTEQMGTWGLVPIKFLAATLTLFQPEGADYADNILMSPLYFESHL